MTLAVTPWRAALRICLRTQQKDGSWDEHYYTGTGFPRVFYLKYHMYRQYFPLLALTTYAKVVAENRRAQLAERPLADSAERWRIALFSRSDRMRRQVTVPWSSTARSAHGWAPASTGNWQLGTENWF